MTDVIDSNLIYVNRKVPPLETSHRPEMMPPEEFDYEFVDVDEENIPEEVTDAEDFTANLDQEIPEGVERNGGVDAIFNN